MTNVITLLASRPRIIAPPADPAVPDERVSPQAFEMFEAVRIAMVAAMFHKADAATTARMAIDAISAHARIELRG